MFQAQLQSHMGPIHHMCHWEMFPSPPLKEDLSQLGCGPWGRVSWAQQPWAAWLHVLLKNIFKLSREWGD